MKSMNIKVFLAAVTLSLAFGLCGLTSLANAQDYNYISAEDVAKIIRDNDQNYAILDIQLQPNFDKAHLRGAIPTYAFPGDKPEMQAMLKTGLEQIKDDQKIVIVCPGGKKGAQNTIDYYRGIGVDNARLLILENGQNGWPKSITDVLVTP